MPKGHVFGKIYYYDLFIVRQGVDRYKQFREYAREDLDLTEKFLDDDVKNWLVELMGPVGTYKEYDHRWYLHDGAVWFRDEKDYLLFLLRWV